MGRGGREGEGSAGKTYAVNKILDLRAQSIFAFYRWKRKIDLSIRSASRIVDEIAQIVCFLEFDFALRFCHEDALVRWKVPGICCWRLNW